MDGLQTARSRVVTGERGRLRERGSVQAKAKSMARGRLEHARLWVQSQRLARMDSEVARATAAALDDVRRQRLHTDDARRLSRIEALRQELLASDEVLAATGSSAPEHLRDVVRISSVPHSKALLLFHLVRRWRPRSSLELGACLGISGAYQGTALALNGAGSLVTIEGNPGRADYAAKNLARLGLDNTRVVSSVFQDVLPTLLPELAPIDYAFIDGHHDERATIEYYEQISPFLSPQSIVVFDDIRWSDGMRRAWSAVRSRPGPCATVNRRQVGVVLVDRAVSRSPVHV